MIVEFDDANAERRSATFSRTTSNTGYYTHTIFHQVFKGYVIVGGSLRRTARKSRRSSPSATRLTTG